MAFVVPAAIGHAPYAAPLLDYLVTHFDAIRITAIRSKLFPELSEDCWLLQADGFGGRSKEFRFGALDHFKRSAAPCETIAVPVREWRESWKRRLRPYLLPGKVREFYRAAASSDGGIRQANIGGSPSPEAWNKPHASIRAHQWSWRDHAGRQITANPVNQILDRSMSAGTAITQGTFPNYHHAPSHLSEFVCLLSVARDVPREFLHPPLSVRRGRRSVSAAIVTVPEASVNKDYRVIPREFDVWTSGQAVITRSKAEAEPMKRAPNH